MDNNNIDTLAALDAVLQARKSAEPDSSYVASLYEKGLDSILKKIAEESGETLMAAKDVQYGGADKDKLIYEVADVWFHLMVLLSHQDLSSTDVTQELARRFGLSGLDEKKQRSEGP